MDCQLKRDVNPFVVVCFFLVTAVKVLLHETENINYFASIYLYLLLRLRTIHQALITAKS